VFEKSKTIDLVEELFVSDTADLLVFSSGERTLLPPHQTFHPEYSITNQSFASSAPISFSRVTNSKRASRHTPEQDPITIAGTKQFHFG